MRIGIDGRELCGRATGVGRYLAHLLQAWDRLPEAAGHRFILYLPSSAPAPGDLATAASGSGDGRVPATLRALALSRLAVDIRLVPGGSGTWWEQVRLPVALRRDRLDVLFSPAYTAPVATRVPVVLALHDLSFAAHPEWYAPRSRVRRRVVAGLSARRARRVLTLSQFSWTEIVSRLGVSGERVRVIPLGVTRLQAATPTPRPPDGRPRPVVLYVGSIFNRRHLPELIRAFALVAPRHRELRLEIVGDNRTYPPQDLAAVAAEAGVGAATTLHSYVSDEALAALYAEAGAFVFLSDYEGFGLTPLEALDAGVPILVGDSPVAREVYRDAAAFVPTTDVPAIAAELERLLFEPAARGALLARAPALLGSYSWERAGRDTLAALVEAARD